jgi:hypothetical protein
MGIRAGQKLVFYAQTQEEYKDAPTKQNNTLACCLVGDSGDCKASPSECQQNHHLLLFKGHYTIRLRDRELPVEKPKS